MPRTLFNLVFVMVVFLTILTAPVLPALANCLGVTVERARDVDVEAAPLERIDADLLQVKITEKSRLARRRDRRAAAAARHQRLADRARRLQLHA